MSSLPVVDLVLVAAIVSAGKRNAGKRMSRKKTNKIPPTLPLSLFHPPPPPPHPIQINVAQKQAQARRESKPFEMEGTRAFAVAAAGIVVADKQ